jgi:hypothetical protein
VIALYVLGAAVVLVGVGIAVSAQLYTLYYRRMLAVMRAQISAYPRALAAWEWIQRNPRVARNLRLHAVRCRDAGLSPEAAADALLLDAATGQGGAS